jgi:hypothetical protein
MLRSGIWTKTSPSSLNFIERIMPEPDRNRPAKPTRAVFLERLKPVLIVTPWLLVVYLGLMDYRFTNEIGSLQEKLNAIERSNPVFNPTNRLYDWTGKTNLTGPWGKLVVIPIAIQPPASFFVTNPPVGESRFWHFPGMRLPEVRTLLETAGVDGDAVGMLLKTARENTGPPGVTLEPPEDFLLAMSAGLRAKVNLQLSQFRDNINIWDPIRYAGGTFEQWTIDSRLSPDTLSVFRRLVYLRNNVLCFSDLSLLFSRVQDPVEKVRLAQILTRTPALEVYLEIKENEDINPLVEYWGIGKQKEMIEPLLEAMNDRPIGGVINIVYLLPRFARTRLNTFALGDDLIEETAEHTHDCKWTALNFFNDVPDERFSSPAARELCVQMSDPIDRPSKLGDLLFFIGKNGEVMHVCVFLAGDIVFTKNGSSPQAPFVLSRLKDVVAFYKPLGMEHTVYRRLHNLEATQEFGRARESQGTNSISQ